VKHRFIVLVCGGRDFTDRRLLYRVLDAVHADTPISRLVQGYARGADRLAHNWAVSRRVVSTGRRYEVTPIMWAELGKQAGYLRNKRMRDDEQPHLVIAFPGNIGTPMMIDLAHEAGIEVLTVARDGSLRSK